ncbi:unnamed protein product [Brassicogethes aeneus]|uniref:Uncharacterized protein n=1 Tax=Brassicogethes aeneus TaxID=1431903 RepID=A0A9P0AWF0_BRAAE|nr:unnamed protein product [Brassicogethes aeneus]
MENATTLFKSHYKKFLVGLSSALAIYLFQRYVYKRVFDKKDKKAEEFPTIDDIQKFIEDLPLDSIKLDKTISLKDLLGELSEFSDDEEWKELIQSVQTLYQENQNC